MRKINDLPKKIILTLAYLGALFILYKLGMKCIFISLFHIPCPGCGMVRSMVSLLKGDFQSALHYHFMFWTMPVVYLYFLFDGNLFRNKKVNKAVFISIVVGFVINWIYHIFFPL